jgi:CPA2 family monovalent cation:H+ antiporter-2
MHSLDLILTLTAGLTVALLFGYITQRLGLSPIVGYLLAGIVVSPSTPGFVADQSIAEQLAEVGVILLMFGVGLQFHLKELLAVKKVAIPGAVVQSLAATALGVVVTHFFGWSWSAGLIFGLAISVASTVVLLRVLSDNRDLHTPTGHIAVGWLVVEDLFTVLVLVLLPAIFGGGETAGPLWLSLVVAVVKVSVLIAAVFVVGGRVVPWLLHRVALTQSRELFTLTVLVVALGIAVASAKVFGVSMALGAFLAGMVVGRSDFSLRAASDALPMRDAFAVLFFVSIGMLLDPKSLLVDGKPALIAATLAIVLVGKPLSAWLIVVALGYPIKTALGVSVALAQIGEFSFILATVGKDLGILPEAGTQALVAAAIVSISINPLIYRTTDTLAAWMMKSKRLRAMLKPRRLSKPEEVREEEEGPSPYRAVIIGYGPIGRTLVRLLLENEVEPSIIDLNFEAVQSAKRQGIPAVYGDATQPDTLREAETHLAGTLILSSSNLTGSAEVIRLARQMNPKIRVLARVGYVAELKAIKQAGADVVFSGEGEVSLALTTAVLRQLGAGGEQIDRERERVRKELVDLQTSDENAAAPAGN